MTLMLKSGEEFNHFEKVQKAFGVARSNVFPLLSVLLEF